MKKAISFILVLALAVGLGLPASAQDSADQALARVTAQVKQTLGIGDGYDTFYGELTDNGQVSYWSLNWSSEEGSLLVEADGDGKVMGYYLNTAGSSTPSSSLLPTFPATSRDQARQLAQAFLDKVLDQPLERASFLDSEASPASSSGQYRFSGQIQLNGLDSPITFSITVRASDGVVLRFYRDDLYTAFVGGIPSPKPTVGREQAGQALKGTLELRLEYVSDGQGGAVLHYLPEDLEEYYVDAQTGELVNLTQRYEDQSGGTAGNGGGDESASAEDGGLSKAEQEGIAKLEGVRSKEALDQAVRALDGLALDSFALTSFRYWVDRETDEVFAVLSYEDKETGSYRSATVDARTGALESLSGGAPYDRDRTAKLTPEQAQEKAETFLDGLWGEQFALTACYDTTERTAMGYYRFTFAQQENGYFFPENSMRVSVDVTSGAICGAFRSFDAQVAFDSPEGIIDDQAALDAWFGTYTTTLGYVAVPQEGNTAALVLGYYLEREEDPDGLDAKTGQGVYSRVEDPGLTYDDIQGSWAQAQVEALASYGIGYYGGSFQPDKQLTQLDLVALLASVQGYRYLPDEEDGADNLYRYAYDAGLITPSQRNDSALLTRGETVKILLDSAGYGEVAALEGIFRCAYSDEASIPTQYYGYAALAQGMGIVGGDGAGRFAAQRTATRLEAAVMLYNFMNR